MKYKSSARPIGSKLMKKYHCIECKKRLPMARKRCLVCEQEELYKRGVRRARKQGHKEPETDLAIKILQCKHLWNNN